MEDQEPAPEISVKTVVIPLDGSALAEMVLPQIIPLAKKMALEANLVRVYDSPADTLPAADAIYLDTFKRHIDGIRREVKPISGARLRSFERKVWSVLRRLQFRAIRLPRSLS